MEYDIHLSDATIKKLMADTGDSGGGESGGDSSVATFVNSGGIIILKTLDANADPVAEIQVASEDSEFTNSIIINDNYYYLIPASYVDTISGNYEETELGSTPVYIIKGGCETIFFAQGEGGGGDN